MFLGYLKIFLHGLGKNRLYAAINVLGLGLGLCCSLLIGLYVQHELGFEQQFTNAERIYRVSREFYATENSIETHLATMAASAAPALKQDFPEVEQVARISMPRLTVIGTEAAVLTNERGFSYADPEVFELFDFQWLAGDAATALMQPYSVVLTASAARRYFADADPLGKTLLMNNRQPLQVTGVIQDLGDQTHLNFSLLASISTLSALNGPAVFDNWGANSYHTFVLLRPGANADNLRSQSGAFFERHFTEGSALYTGFTVTALKDIHLHTRSDLAMSEPGSATVVNMFALVAVFILFIACINFTNLTASRLVQRGNEIGMRKVVGATRGMLVGQLLFESVVLSALALLFGVVLMELLLPWFGSLLGMQLTLELGSPQVLLSLAGLAVMTGLLAGLYPALYLSGFGAAGMLKGLTTLGRGLLFRKALVVLQFAVSISLLVAMSVVYLQMQYVSDLELGYDKEQVVVLSGSENEGLGLQWSAFKQQLLAHPEILSVTASNMVPSTSNPEALGLRTEGGSIDNGKGVTNMWVDFGFFETYGIKLVAGRSFSEEFGTDRTGSLQEDGSPSMAFVINARAAREFGWNAEEAVGKYLQMLFSPNLRGPVIGVVEDVLMESVRSPVKSLVYAVPPDQAVTGFVALREASIRVSGRDMTNTLAYIDSVWQEFLPDQPVSRRFLDQDFSALYAAEKLEGQVFALFSLLAIFIACLGLYGLATINVERRTKEIGVRKVMGGSMWSIVLLLTNDFSKLVLLANVIAWPVAYFAMERWLQNFAYRIDLTPLIFIGSGLIALCIAWVTVGGTAAKAASQKPVLALRYE